MFYKQGRLDDAIMYYHKAIAIQPDLAAAYWNLGKILEQQGRINEGLFYQKKALDLQPELEAFK
jgi:tetratricopeptide (TPR) repeat protein